ncbi:BMA_0021/BMA_0022 family TOMM bacteriocin [Archangium sp.]|uniref:BMA_0021/BMA_0022 family TOMM bacteriocin n=1 Tax=Archangium sp. TaxID=1872627 RepID=UPI002D6DC672|nr:BMA_0021/BMA_0022 family TOMM bacteriocin [Archangium sp.]HYO59081.1 BMA_0021/BMA_0022 family TOMM bacteriocin [Archangium sp.]
MHKSGTVEWMRVWRQAVALSWRDEAFKRELLQDARQALRTRFQYDLPEHIDLKQLGFSELARGWMAPATLPADAPEREHLHKYDSVEWMHVWQRAIALSWRDESFKQALLADVRKALYERFQYILPEHVDMSVYESDDPGHGWKPHAGGTWALPLPQLVLTLPPPPESPEQEPLALADLPQNTHLKGSH